MQIKAPLVTLVCWIGPYPLTTDQVDRKELDAIKHWEHIVIRM